jgi:hypothetical protein
LSSDPVRLRVSYKTPESLLGEFTRSVGKGGVAIESRKGLAVGTQFVFELSVKGVKAPLEVLGEVTQCRAISKGKFLVTIRYDAATDRRALDELLQRISDSHKYEKVRKFPRLPINVPATEEQAYSASYVIRDISLGGLGVEVEAEKLPLQIRAGEPFFCEIQLQGGALALHGEVAWTYAPPAERAKLASPAFGVKFGRLRVPVRERLQRILELRGLPPPPWRARLSFGLDAVSRMP